MAALIDSQIELAALVDRAGRQPLVALDTELVWERTYYPNLGIVQLALSDSDLHLIDATAVDLAALGPLLADAKVIKILHDAVQDLAILKRAGGAAPRSVFDTRVAAGFAGLSSTISLRDLLAELVDVDLHKTETRTDWLRRPLTETQVGYALDDVRFLHAAHRELLGRARERGVESWMREEMSSLDDERLYEERDPRHQFERIKGRGRLTRRELGILRQLTAWREREARAVNRPRGWVMSDRMLLMLAQCKPAGTEELSRFRDRRLRRYGKAVVGAVKEGLEIPEEGLPCGHPRSRYEKTFAARSKAAIELLERRSADKGIDHALVATRSEVRALVRDGEQANGERHALLRGWRDRFVGAELMAGISCEEV